MAFGIVPDYFVLSNRPGAERAVIEEPQKIYHPHAPSSIDGNVVYGQAFPRQGGLPNKERTQEGAQPVIYYYFHIFVFFLLIFFLLLLPSPPVLLYLSLYLHNNSIHLNLCAVQLYRPTKPEREVKKNNKMKIFRFLKIQHLNFSFYTSSHSGLRIRPLDYFAF